MFASDYVILALAFLAKRIVVSHTCPRPFNPHALPRTPLLECLDKVLCWEVFAVFVFAECGVVLPLIFVALVLGLPDALFSD
jgi:hypothetical protein